MNEWGYFPFGRPNTVRPARITPRSEAIVIGVYPSAWHVAWRAPPGIHPRGQSGGVAALAVDVEPTVFWDGKTDDFAERLARWKKDAGFIDGTHGSISSVSPSTNGSSGDKLVHRYLAPLGLDVERVSFTDVYPVFLVKTSNGKRREQGDAIRDEYDRIATQLGVSVCTLPPRIHEKKLPALAASTFGERILADLMSSEARLVITLGKEVWETLLAIPSLRARAPAASLTDLYGDAYGSRGSLTVGGREVEWLPLVHPGLLKGKAAADAMLDPRFRTIHGWATLHARWAKTMTDQRLR